MFDPRGFLLSSIGILVALVACAPMPCEEDQRCGIEATALDSSDACRDVDCSGLGSCHAEDGRPFCLCEEGHSAVGLECVPLLAAPAELADPPLLRAGGDDIVAVAVAEEGRGPNEVGEDVSEYPYDLGRYLDDGEAWCSEFVSWAYEVAGLPFTGGYEGGWMLKSTTQVRSWFQSQDAWVAKGSAEWEDFEPFPGDYMRLDTSGGGHSTIVRYVEGGTLYTVEGNASNQVQLRQYPDYKSYPSIDGIGLRGPRNRAPQVDAGDGVVVLFPSSATLVGTADDDGIPEATLITKWSKLEGPGEVRFADDSALETTVELADPGAYVLGLTANDGALEATDQVVVVSFQRDDLTAAEVRGPAFVPGERPPDPPELDAGIDEPASGDELTGGCQVGGHQSGGAVILLAFLIVQRIRRRGAATVAI